MLSVSGKCANVIKKHKIPGEILRYSSANINNVKYQYLQNSKVPTMHFQPSLPRLPIPKLEDSCGRYLNSIQPLLSAEDFEGSKARVNDFVNNDGKKLDQILRDYDKSNKQSSYISELWFDMYLRDRLPLPINYNPIVVFQNDPRKEYNNQAVRASNLLISSLRFMLSLRAGILEPEVYHMNAKKSDTQLFRNFTRVLPSSVSWYGAYLFKAFPLDMSQYMGLFGSTRIPEQHKDRILRDETSRHILVQRRGRFYVFDVLDANGNLLDIKTITASIKKILSDDRPPTEYPIGILTTMDRNAWAAQREHLVGIGNAAILKQLDTAIFNLILDDDELAEDKHKLLRHYMHGDGTNRWFDKSFSLIVTKDGNSGLNFEHSWGDGVAILRYFEDVLKDSTTNSHVHPDDLKQDGNVNIAITELDFRLDNRLKQCIHQAKHEYDAWCSTLGIDFLIYDKLGKSSCKSLKVSPDLFMQLGFQAAYHLMYGKYVGTYESCSTAAYKHGRTEAMRPLTVHTKEFCDSIHSSKPKNNADLKELIYRCSENHAQLTKEAALGNGFDRHLFGLRKMAELNNIAEPAFFSTDEYRLLNKSILSTSTLSSPSVLAGGFGPVERSGFGIGYSVFEHMLGTAVTSYSPHNNPSSFVAALDKSFKEIQAILSS